MALLWLLDVPSALVYRILRARARNRPRQPIALPSTCAGIAPVNATTVRLSELHGTPTACVVYLLLAPKHDDARDYGAEIERSIASLNTHLHTPEFTHILVFTDEALPRALARKLASSVFPVRVVALDPDYLALPISGAPGRWTFVRCSAEGVGHPPVFNYRYLELNAFRLSGLWRHPAVAGMDYVMLVDTDLVLTGDFPTDLFQGLDADHVHAHTLVFKDPAECVPGLHHVQFYMRCAGIHPKRSIGPDDIVRCVFSVSSRSHPLDFFKE